MSSALEYAKHHAAERTAEALAALADPEESSFVLGVAAGMYLSLTLFPGFLTCSVFCHSIFFNFNGRKLLHAELSQSFLMFEHS